MSDIQIAVIEPYSEAATKVNCEVCKKVFDYLLIGDGRPRLTCSKRCLDARNCQRSNASHQRKREAENQGPQTRKCPECAKDFSVDKKWGRLRIMCSQECYKARRQRGDRFRYRKHRTKVAISRETARVTAFEAAEPDNYRDHTTIEGAVFAYARQHGKKVNVQACSEAIYSAGKIRGSLALLRAQVWGCIHDFVEFSVTADAAVYKLRENS